MTAVALSWSDSPKLPRMAAWLVVLLVHGVAQLLGLWPPGYIVDPCELGKQDMDYFQNAVEEADRDMLRAAVLQVSTRCR